MEFEKLPFKLELEREMRSVHVKLSKIQNCKLLKLNGVKYKIEPIITWLLEMKI